jgi:F-box and WD-40 domain protein CDC4
LQFDSQKIVSGSDDHTIHIYNTELGELHKRLTGHEGGVWALQYWNDTLVSGSTDRTVRIWDMDTGECTHVFDGHTSTVRCLLIINPTTNLDGSLSPETPIIVTGSRDTTLRVWRLPDPKKSRWTPASAPIVDSSLDPVNAERARNPYFEHLLTGHTNSVRAIAGHGNTLISGSYDCTVKSWDLATGRNVFTFRGHREKVYSVGYCPELDRAVSGSMDATVRIWCTKTGAALYNLEGHTSLVGLLEVSPTTLVSAAADASLRVWCPKTGKCLANLVGHSAAITCFHHDTTLNRIVSGSDGGVKIWELNSLGYGTSSLVSSSVVPEESPLADKLMYTTSPQGLQPIYGRFIHDVLDTVQGVWRVRMDESRLICACQRDNGSTWFEVLDFSVDDSEVGKRLNMPGDRTYGIVDQHMDDAVDEDEE